MGGGGWVYPVSVLQKHHFTGGLIDGADQKRVSRFPAHYVGCWNYRDLSEYLLVSPRYGREESPHIAVPGLRSLAGSIGLLEKLRLESAWGRGCPVRLVLVYAPRP